MCSSLLIHDIKDKTINKFKRQAGKYTFKCEDRCIIISLSYSIIILDSEIY